uniref:Uncharacterized protein n=1 Tax=Bubo bubo TaxID=30461 RepID=A0A8C0EUM0_BUBBB
KDKDIKLRIRAHLWPFLSSGIISCFVTRWKNHDWRVDRRLVIHQLLGAGRNRVGNSTGRLVPRRCGMGEGSRGIIHYWWGLVQAVEFSGLMQRLLR